MTDSEIIAQILQGNTNQYRLLVERYQQMVFRTCMGFLHNKPDADDLTQEVFIKAFKSLASFKGNAAFSTWIYRIAVNSALNKTRKLSNNFILQRLDTLFGSDKNKEINISVSDFENPENILITNEHKEWIQKALNSLPHNQQTAIVLSKYDDLPQKEIAEIMGITEGAVEALIQRAKAKLRQLLTKNYKK